MLRVVIDPELDINIVDLGLVYEIELKGSLVNVTMTLTSPGCPFGPYIVQQVQAAGKTMKGIEDVNVEIVWDPPWGPEYMSEDIRLELGFDV